VALGDVVDQLHDDDGLADAGAAERAGLAALGEGADEVDDLDAGLEDLRLGVLVDQRGAGRWIGYACRTSPGRGSSTGSPVTLKMRPRTPFADRDGDRGAGVGDGHAALEALGRGHGDGARDPAGAEVLLDLEREALLLAAT
jgi:hypothetical protein